VADFLETEVARLPCFQVELARWALGRQERDPALWPREELPAFYDPEVHAPAQPIPRRRLAPDSARVRAAARELGLSEDARAFRYDWSSGGIVRRAGVDLAERAFELALAGAHPRRDLVEALVLRELDDGAERKALAAFAHAYTDRAGNVYGAITLYDAWGSGKEIEMPDVDCLGIVHEVLGDWTTWRSIVPSSQHEALYRRIGELYVPARAQRELRNALARCFLSSAEVGPAWSDVLDNLHALWEDCASTPATLAARLPSAAASRPDAPAWKEWLAAWVAECHERGEIFQRGRARRATLAEDGAAIRATLLRVLEEYGAYERGSPARKSNEEPPHGGGER
jgi:hypothetical protein